MTRAFCDRDRDRFAGAIGALVLTVLALGACGCARKTGIGPTLNLVTTTTTQDSGLLDRLVPSAARALGLHIRVIAVGSGEALKLAERGEADVVMAHSPAAEEKSVAAGHLVDRVPLMWNQFLIVRPGAGSGEDRRARRSRRGLPSHSRRARDVRLAR